MMCAARRIAKVTPLLLHGPCEDFAETFILYVRYQGQLPGHLNLPSHFGFDPIKRKWKFIAELISVIDSGRTKW
jgi:hypothetical protein